MKPQYPVLCLCGHLHRDHVPALGSGCVVPGCGCTGWRPDYKRRKDPAWQ